jgi:hypothetical protein
MLAKVSLRLRLWLFVLPTARVSKTLDVIDKSFFPLTVLVDANLFKDAFITAQQENEKLFTQDA